MPRRNLHCLVLVTMVSLLCYQKAPGSRCAEVLSDAMDRVARRFYRPVDEAGLFEGAMSGMMRRLGDEHSKYIPAAEKQVFEDELNREDTVEGYCRGAEGRWNFLLPGEPSIGYVRISGFVDAEQGGEGTAGDFRAALQELRQAKMRGLVLDLRDNLGGSLKSAVEICDMLVRSGEIVTTRGRDGRIQRAYRASGRAAFTDFPMAVLVDRATASASEIVAACLQDHGRAVVVGERSYGKGTVQEVDDLGQTLGAMKFTIATYWRPSGQDINRLGDDPRGRSDAPRGANNATWGVSPDEGCEVSLDDRQRQRLLRRWQKHGGAAGRIPTSVAADAAPDPVLAKAVEYLKAKN